MIIEHKISRLIRDVSKDEIQSFLRIMIGMKARLEIIWDAITDYGDGAADIEDVVDAMDANRLADINVLKELANSRVSMNNSFNNYFCRIVLKISTLADNMKLACDIGDMDDDELKVIRDGVHDSLAGVLYVLLWEFGCFDTYSTAKEKPEDPVIDELLYREIGRNIASVNGAVACSVEFAENVRNKSTVFKMKLDIFDKAPEKEAPFEAVLGPRIGDIDQKKLTMEMVDDIISGKMLAEELVEKIGYGASGTDSAEQDKSGVESVQKLFIF